MAYWDQRCKKVLTDIHYRSTFSIVLADEKIAFEVSAKLYSLIGKIKFLDMLIM
jgi:hypothetical protein